MKKQLLVAVAGIICATSMSAQASSLAADKLSLDQLKSLNQTSFNSITEQKKLDIRVQGMQDTAIRIGAQRGLYDGLVAFEGYLKENQSSLDGMFDFRRVMTLARTDESEIYMLPAVLEESEENLDVDPNGRSLVVSDKTYRIIKPERLVSAPPTWWDYLSVDTVKPNELPPVQLMPKNDEESKLWEAWIDEGYMAGLEQASFEINERIRQLGRDFQGMQVYLRLAELGMLDDPAVVALDTRVRGDESETVLRESTYRITASTSLNQNMDQWRSYFTDNSASVRDESEFYRVVQVKEKQASDAK